MNSIKLPNLVFLLMTLMVTSAQARYYRCNFANDGVQIFISTQYKRVTITDAKSGSTHAIKKSKRVTIGNETRDVFLMDNGDDVQVILTESGKDGVTEFYYPYTGVYSGLHGGCETEDKQDEIIMSRNKSLSNRLGEVVVNSWPGEFGNERGVRLSKTTTFAAGTTWMALTAFQRETKACTIKKGTRFVPVARRSGEEYVYLSQPEEFVAKKKSGFEDDDLSYRKGDHLVQLYYESEGYCLVEKAGFRYDVLCLNPDGVEFQKVSSEVIQSSDTDLIGKIPKVGKYVFTRCEEGHYTWIPLSLIK